MVVTHDSNHRLSSLSLAQPVVEVIIMENGDDDLKELSLISSVIALTSFVFTSSSGLH